MLAGIVIIGSWGHRARWLTLIVDDAAAGDDGDDYRGPVRHTVHGLTGRPRTTWLRRLEACFAARW